MATTSTKASIENPSIRIRPAAALCDFIAGLSAEQLAEGPSNVRTIWQLYGTDNSLEATTTKSNNEPTLTKPALTDRDAEFLKELKLSSSDGDFEFVRLADVLSTGSVDSGDEDDEDDVEKDEKEDAKVDAKAKVKPNKRDQKLIEQRKQKQRAHLTLSDLIWLNTLLMELRKNGVGGGDFVPVYLHQLLVGCRLLLPRNARHKRDPLLEKRCVRLRLEQDARVYNAMTKNVDSSRRQLPDETIAYQMKSINRQMIGVAQFLFSVAAGFAFGFVGLDLMIGGLEFGVRLMLGISIALVIAVAEVYFLTKQLNEEHDLSVAGGKVSLKEATAGVAPPKEIAGKAALNSGDGNVKGSAIKRKGLSRKEK